MGIIVEYNPDLALRNYAEFEAGRREEEECIPPNLQVGKRYPFLKNDHRNYFLAGEIPLLETQGNGVLSRPKASIKIIESTHFLKGAKPMTKGLYEVIEVFLDDEIYFEGFERITHS